MKKSEAQIMKEIEIAVSAHGHRVFRVNVGEGYLYREQPTQETLEFENKRARWLKADRRKATAIYRVYVIHQVGRCLLR